MPVAALTGTVSGWQGSDSQATAATGTLTWNSNVVSTGGQYVPGRYSVSGSGLSANNDNYEFVQAVGNQNALTVVPGAVVPERKDSESTAQQRAVNAVTNIVPQHTSIVQSQDVMDITNNGVRLPAGASSDVGGNAISINGTPSGYSLTQVNNTVTISNNNADVKLVPAQLNAIPVYTGSADSPSQVGGVSIAVNSQSVKVENADTAAQHLNLGGTSEFIGEVKVTVGDGTATYKLFKVGNVISVQAEDQNGAAAMNKEADRQVVIGAAAMSASEKLAGGLNGITAIYINEKTVM